MTLLRAAQIFVPALAVVCFVAAIVLPERRTGLIEAGGLLMILGALVNSAARRANKGK